MSAESIVKDVQKTVHDMKAAEHGGRKELSAVIDDIHNEELKFKKDPASLAAYKKELNKEFPQC